MNLPTRLDGGGATLPPLWANDASKPDANPGVRRSVRISAGLLLVMLVLASFVPIGGAVIGSGQVGVESRVKRIAHPTGGVIAEITIANGEHVEKGALLMRLDDRVTGADAIYSSLTVEQLLAQKARLEAERLGTGSIIFPRELTNTPTESARQIIADEQHLFVTRRAEERQLRAQLAARIAQYREQIRGFKAQIASLNRQRTLIEPERQGVKDLWNKQLVTINRLNQLERTVADIDGTVGSLQAQIAQARARIAEAQEQSIQLGESRRVQAATDLARVNTTLNEERRRNVAASDQQDRREIRAPYTGTVEKLTFSAIGDVVRPAEPILEIVPDRDVMVVEAAISPVDIDQVRSGQSARVHFTSFNRATTPEIPGKVIYVATDRSDSPKGEASFFRARIAIDQAALRREGLTLRSGMPVDVFIRTSDRPLLSYVTKPMRDQFSRAFRDN